MSDVDMSGFYKGFMGFWNVLDAMFSFIEDSFQKIFNAIPGSAIPFLIAIFSYSIVAIFLININHQKEGNKVIVLKIFYYIFLLFVILFSIWRLGIISMIDDEDTVQSFAEFFINLVYILFAIILFISFYREVPWISKVLLILIWALFLILTFIICPLTSDFELSDSTLIQVLLVAAIFATPNLILGYQKTKEGGKSDD